MGTAASSSSASPAAVAGGSSLLLAPTRPVAGRWAAVTDGTARGGDTVLSILEGGGQEEGALRLQGSLGALEGNVRRLVGFAIADCAVDPAARSQLARAGTQGLRLAYRHDPPDARFQLRLLSRGLAPQESFMAPLLSSTTQATPGAITTVIIPYSAFRLQYRGRPQEDRAGERIDPSALTSVGIEITRSSQPPPLYARVPLPFEFILLSPGIEAVP